MQNKGNNSASFRDPDGFVFKQNGVNYRQVNASYAADYQLLMASGLYAELVKKHLLIPHKECDLKSFAEHPDAYLIVEPEQLSFVSYPYEWSFSQLKDAALVTLEVQALALSFGMCLKDASAYNIQFHKGKPVFIDTLSFTTYKEGEPWQAFRQFCQHFLAPLALMKNTDIQLSQLLRIHIDGIPLDLASRLLPFKTRFNLTLATNIHLHARFQSNYGSGKEEVKQRKVSKNGILGLVSLLRGYIKGLDWKPKGTEWAAYYTDTNYTAAGLAHKKETLRSMLDKAAPKRVLDLGANNGVFSRIAAEKAEHVISSDIDPSAVEQNYMQVCKANETNLLPLLVDLTNPPGASGWANVERGSFLDRAKVDLTMMLALIHHLCISNNLPFEEVAAMAAKQSNWLIIEFVPKQDSQVQRLLLNRKDIFLSYDQSNFELAFTKHYKVVQKEKVMDSDRVLYLMERYAEPGR